MKHASLPSTGLLGSLGFAIALALGACKPEPAAPAASTVAAKPADAAAAPADAVQATAHSAAAPTSAAPTAVASERDAAQTAQRPETNLANARNPKRYEGGLEKLDSDYDLSKVDLGGDHTDGDGHDHGQQVPNPTQEQLAAQSGQAYTAAQQAERNKGRISMVEGQNQTFEFGHLRQGDLGQHEFQMVSDGEEPLVVTSVKPSCGCTKAELVLYGAEGEKLPYTKGDPIPLGTRFGIEAEITTDGRQGNFSAQISVFANDPRGTFNVRLTAEIEPVFTVLPTPTVFFGRVTTAEDKEQSVTVKSTRGELFKLTQANETPNQSIQVEYLPKEPDAEGRAAEWEVKVKLQPGSQPGMQNFPLSLKTDMEIAHPKYPNQDGSPQFHTLMVSIQAQVVGMVSAEPSFLTFGMVRPGEPVERTLRLECHDDFQLRSDIPVVFEGLQGQAFPYADVFQVAVEPAEDGKAADVKVKLTGFPTDQNGSFSGVLKIQVGHPHLPELQVRFSGVCRPALPSQTGEAPR
jgi:hypothetical protein